MIQYEQKTKTNLEKIQSNNHKHNSRRCISGYRTLLNIEGWSVIPILNPMQKTMGRILDEAKFGFIK